jgi:membrane fusion protein (multidrug efflux system)
MKRYTNILHFFISAIICGITQGCHVDANQAKDNKDDKGQKVAVPKTEGFILHKGSLFSSLAITGELQAFQQVDLYAKINSFVKRLYADVGTEVRTGQLLAIMEAPEITSQLAGADSRIKSTEAVYIASKANYDRLYEASKNEGIISPNDLDLALGKMRSDEAIYESSQAAYKEIMATQNYLEIRAPFDGIVTARGVSAGAYAGPSGKGSENPIFSLEEQSKLRLVVAVPDAYSIYLKEKGSIRFTINSIPGEKFTAHISRMAGALDTRLRSQRIEMDVYNTDKDLLPGMVAEITIPLVSAKAVFVVPKTAVINSYEGSFIVKDSGGFARWVRIQQGRTVHDSTEIYGDLKEGDTLVRKATEETRNNERLNN